MFTPEEKAFIKNIFSQLTVNASDPNSAATVAMVHSILSKIAEPEQPQETK